MMSYLCTTNTNLEVLSCTSQRKKAEELFEVLITRLDSRPQTSGGWFRGSKSRTRGTAPTEHLWRAEWERHAEDGEGEGRAAAWFLPGWRRLPPSIHPSSSTEKFHRFIIPRRKTDIHSQCHLQLPCDPLRHFPLSLPHWSSSDTYLSLLSFQCSNHCCLFAVVMHKLFVFYKTNTVCTHFMRKCFLLLLKGLCKHGPHRESFNYIALVYYIHHSKFLCYKM